MTAWSVHRIYCVAGSIFPQLCAAKVGRRYESVDVKKDTVTSRKSYNYI